LEDFPVTTPSLIPPSAAYTDYMQLDTLLSLQRPACARVHPDELHFQTVHQVTELLLQCTFEDLDRAAAAIDANDPLSAERLAWRARVGVGVARAAVELLAGLTLRDYHTIRLSLGTSSAAESPGWARIRRSGAGLAKALTHLLTRQGIDLVDVYLHGDTADPVHRLAEAMVGLDVACAEWRFAHFSAAARLIGAASTGTQGMPVDGLGRAIHHRMFPDLWHVRQTLTEQTGAGLATSDRRSRP